MDFLKLVAWILVPTFILMASSCGIQQTMADFVIALAIWAWILGGAYLALRYIFKEL